MFAADTWAVVSQPFARERTASTLAVRQSEIHHNNKDLRITFSDPTEPREGHGAEIAIDAKQMRRINHTHLYQIVIACRGGDAYNNVWVKFD